MRIIFSSVQWAFFILAGSIVAPLAIGLAFHLSQPEIAAFLQRSLFVIGAATLLQVLFGHRLPIYDGPAGLWWGAFLMFAGIAAATKVPPVSLLPHLEMGLLISGALLVGLGLLRVISIIKKIFTPVVTGTYMILLVAQLSGSFLKGVLGIGYLGPNIELRVAIPALLTLVVTALLGQSRRPMLRNYSVLIGIAFGWIVFAAAGISKPAAEAGARIFTWPALLPFGRPQFDAGIVFTSVFTALLLLSNLIASVNVVEKAVGRESKPVFDRAGLFMGISQILSGLFGAVGMVPVSSSAGFIETTKLKDRLSFGVGSAMVLVISFFPHLTMFFASLPVPVGYAAVFTAFANLIGIGLREYASGGYSEDRLLIIGISLLVGLGGMFIPAEALQELPAFLSPLLTNGLVLGVIVCILLEQGIRRDRHSVN